MVILSSEGDTGNQLKSKLKKISNAIARHLPEIEIKGITNKKGMIRKTAHSYPHLFSGTYGQVRDKIIIESSWLGHFEPYSTAEVSSFIADMMRNNNQSDMINEFGLNPFKVQVLNPERTLCEKIMSLVRFSYSKDPISDLRNKIRHTYDVHLMLKNASINQFFMSNEFEVMLQKVGHDDLVSFKNNNLWLSQHPDKALIFSKTHVTWQKIKSVYNTIFAELVFGSLPDETEIEETLFQIAKRLNKIDWEF